MENSAMASRFDRDVDRRQFLKQAGCAACAMSGVALAVGATAAFAEDPPNVHNMLVVGEQTIFLSHLPMFEGLNSTKAAFRSAHRYQVILEAQFTQAGKDVSELYLKDRQAHPETPIYTLMPSQFVVSRLFTPKDKPRLREFTAEVTRGHLERPGHQTIAGLEETLVKATRVVHGGQFEPKSKKPAQLEYILFGKGPELFLAHAISGPPDFDHVLSVKLEGHELGPDDLTREVRVVVPDRKNVSAERLREAQQTPATIRIGGAESSASKVQLVAGREFYFEEGELLVPPTFEPTPEEKKK
jgi:hypothetical protein